MADSFLIILLGGAVLVAGLVMLAIISKSGTRSKLNQDEYEAHFKSAYTQINDSNAGRQLAVVNADKLLDKAMKELGFKGQTMGERLKSGRARFSDANSVWEAHKLRNRIAHEHDISVSEGQAEKALRQLQKALKDLGALR